MKLQTSRTKIVTLEHPNMSIICIYTLFQSLTSAELLHKELHLCYKAPGDINGKITALILCFLSHEVMSDSFSGDVMNSPAVLSRKPVCFSARLWILKNTNRALWVLVPAVYPAVEQWCQKSQPNPTQHPWDSFSASKYGPMSSFCMVMTSGITSVFLIGAGHQLPSLKLTLLHLTSQILIILSIIGYINLHWLYNKAWSLN